MNVERSLFYLEPKKLKNQQVKHPSLTIKKQTCCKMEFIKSKLSLTTLTASSRSKVKPSISIQLDRPLPVYFAGEVISGRVIVTYEKRKKVQGNVKNVTHGLNHT